MERKITLAGHRGWRAYYPENTMLGFRETLKLDVDAIEMDVHMTKDHHIVVCHDPNLSRTTDTEGLIHELTLEQIRAADAGISFGEEFKGEKIPTFLEFLELMATRPDVRLLLELKDYPEVLGDFAYTSAEKTLSLCKEYGIFGRERLTVITFSTGLCAWLRSHYAREDFFLHGFYPKTRMHGSDKDDPYQYYDEVCIFHHNPDGTLCLTDPVVERSVFQDFINMGIRPCVYFKMNTDEDAYRRAFQYGAQGFTCDHPDICIDILDRIGARPKHF